MLRLGNVRVSGELMRELFFTPSAPGRWFRVREGLPADAEYVRSWHDAVRDEWVFVYTHSTFTEAPPGCHVLDLRPPVVESMTIPPDPAPDADTPHIASEGAD